MQNLTLITRLFSVFAMTGVIWFVQLVTYPQFLLIRPEDFVEFHADYSRRISFLVIPLMLAELISAFAVFVVFRKHKWLMVGSGLTFLTWIVTFTIQVPQHASLSEGYSEETIRALVAGNWIRTAIWSANSVFLLTFLYFRNRSKNA